LSDQEILKLFPCPEFRPYQRATILKINECLNSGVRCILLDSPTGSGKSVINTVFCRAITPAFYATPQLSLIDQIRNDPHIGKYYTEIKGRQNYPCIKDKLFDSTVDIGMCRRYSGFVPTHCSPRDECPYWIQKWKAFFSDAVLCSFSYLILEGLVDKVPPGLGERELLVLDESHNIAEHVVQQVSLVVSPFTLPEKIYNQIYIGEIKTSSEMYNFIDSIRVMCEAMLEDYQLTLEGGRISIADAKTVNMLEEWIEKSKWYLETYGDYEWIWSVDYVTYKGEVKKKLVLQPLYARPFCPTLVWKRGRIYIVSSATILDPDLFVEETGLDLILEKDEIKHIQVPCYFPPENRRIVDLADEVGSMRREDQEVNLAKAAEAIAKIAEKEKGKNIAIMCPSYDLAKRTYSLLPDEVKAITLLPKPEDREIKLEEWLSKRGRLFFAVAYHEGQDWKGDLCLLPEEKIITSEGVKMIKEIKEGDFVLTHKGRFRRVSKVFVRKYSGEVYKIKPYYNAPFCVTPEHRILTERGFIQAKNVKLTDKICLPVIEEKDMLPEVVLRKYSGNQYIRRKLTKQDFRLLGWYVAEGGVNKGDGVHSPYFYITNYNQDFLQEIKELTINLTGKGTIYGGQVVCHDAGWARWFLENFKDKTLPEWVLTAPVDFIKEFICGYWKGDGYVGERASSTSKSETLVHQIRHLLFKLGICSAVSGPTKPKFMCVKGSKKYLASPTYNLQVSRTQIKKLAELTGLNYTKHKEYKTKFSFATLFGSKYVLFPVEYVETEHYDGLVYNLEVEEDNSYTGVSCVFHNCEALILLKTLYPDIKDKRVARRLEKKEFRWYMFQGLKESLQALGRIHRSEEDKKNLYILDAKFWRLVRQWWKYVPDWFKEVVPFERKPLYEQYRLMLEAKKRGDVSCLK